MEPTNPHVQFAKPFTEWRLIKLLASRVSLLQPSVKLLSKKKNQPDFKFILHVC